MTDQDTAREDLAFMRAIVEEGQPFARNFGFIYGWSGAIYAAQCLFFAGAIMTNATLPQAVWLVASALPTVIFLAILAVGVLNRRRFPKPKGPVPRAIDAAFSGTGLANLAMIAVFGITAVQRGDFTFWLFYASVVCALQGAVWYGAAVLRRRGWMGLVAVGWLVSALATGLLVHNIGAYLLVLAFALTAFMAVPGFALLRMNSDA